MNQVFVIESENILSQRLVGSCIACEEPTSALSFSVPSWEWIWQMKSQSGMWKLIVVAPFWVTLSKNILCWIPEQRLPIYVVKVVCVVSDSGPWVIEATAAR